MTENGITVYQQKIPTPEESLQLQKIATGLFKSGMYKNVGNEFGAFAVIQYGAEMGIPPMQSLQKISIIQGKPACDSQLLLALAERRGIEWNIIEESDTKCIIEFHKGKKSYKSQFTIEDAKLAGLTGKDNWKKQPKTMLFWRAVSNGLRKIDPGGTLGLYTVDEMDSATGFESAKNITPEKPVDPPAETNNDENEFVSLIKELTQDNESLYDYFDTKIHELTNRKYNHYAHFINSHKDFVKKELDGDYSIATEMLSQNFEMYEKCYLLYIESKLKAKEEGSNE